MRQRANDKIKIIMAAPSYPQAYFGGKGSTTPSLVPTKRRRRSRSEELHDFIASLPHGAALLDVGCGDGRALASIKKQRPDIRLWGIDISDVSFLLPAGVEFTLGSAEDLTQHYKPDTFDAVVCRHVIEHLVSPLSLISGIREVLRPGGRVLMETPNWTRLFMPFSFLYFWNDYTHIRPYTSASMHRMFLDFQFSVDSLNTLSSCGWHTPKYLKGSKVSIESTASSEPSPNSITYTHKRSSVFTRGFAYLVNPLFRDLLIATGTKN